VELAWVRGREGYGYSVNLRVRQRPCRCCRMQPVAVHPKKSPVPAFPYQIHGIHEHVQT
jgi:hypothetical protein